jgi:MerR family transcriptional regulator, redox-sensitive transcriptional activator SoxR
MEGMTIGDVARRTGLAQSAIRYYESLGLLPEPARVGGKRRYDESVLGWLALIALARQAGFTMAETRELIDGFEPDTPPDARWQALATRKLAEIDAQVERAARMREVLKRGLDCGCLGLADCVRLLPV